MYANENIFFDFEFHHKYVDGGVSITPLSIGLVSERKESTLYLELTADLAAVGKDDPWLVDHVIPHLRAPGVKVVGHSEAAQAISSWARRITVAPTFWAYRAAQDWVCMMALYGGYTSLPKFFDKSCRDIAEISDRSGIAPMTEIGGPVVAHNALSDAQWARGVYKYFLNEGIIRGAS